MKSPLAWHYIDPKKSINAALTFKLSTSDYPSREGLESLMKELSDFYPGLRSAFEVGFLGSVKLVDNQQENIFYRDQIHKDLEQFAVSEVNFNFEAGTRLYYIALAKLADGKVAICFNAHHMTADAVVHEALAEVFLAWILRGEKLDLETFKKSKTFTLTKKGRTTLLDWLRFAMLFVGDYFSYMKKIALIKSSDKTLMHRIHIEKSKMSGPSLDRSNALLCAAFMKAFGESLSFENHAVKTIHMVNTRNKAYTRNSPNFAMAMVSAITVNQRVGESLADVTNRNLFCVRRSFKHSVAYLTSDLQYYFFRAVNLLRLGHVCHICFSNTEKIESSILTEFDEIEDGVAIPSLGRNSPYMTSIIINRPESWEIDVVYLERYFHASQLVDIEDRMRKMLCN